MTAELRPLLPEIVLIVAAVAIYIGGAFLPARGTWRWIAAGALIAATVLLWNHNPNASGDLARYVRWFALAAGGLLLSLGAKPLRFDGTPEYVGSLLLTVAGLMLAAGAEDIILLFISLELISIPTYVLLYLGRNDAAAQESAAKYFFLGVLSSAILLYGFSFLYGATGSSELSAISTASPSFAVFARLALALIFAGLCFKTAAVPFHFYAPDVYQGTTHANAALLSVVPKAAGFVVMARILVQAAPGMEPYSWAIVLAAALLTMTFGNVMALWQDDFRRLLAYSSIAQAGYMLLALAVALVPSGEWDGLGALWFYLTTYAAATIGAFAAMERLGREDHRLDAIDDLAGLGRTRPATAAAMAVCMFSLAGIPPLAGFWGKLLVFGGALNVEAPASARWWFAVAAVVAVLNAAVAAAYYLRIVAAMYFRIPLATPPADGGRGAWFAAVACAAVVVGAGFYPGPLMRAGDFRQRQTPRLDVGAERGPSILFRQEKTTATPTCPTAWSGGDEKSSCPNTLAYCLRRRLYYRGRQ
ncbi:MAG: NADH-quinone oxidoreductase subunit N [Pirellulales bacterium]|nr:NADH-quinone oxidoreductase subunit N [Pirellulales bacterium]